MRTATLTPVFWNPAGLSLAYPAGYETEIEQFLADVAADSGKETDFYSVLPQYYEGAGASIRHVEYAVTTSVALHDTGALPKGFEELCTTPFEGSSRPCVTDKGVRTELKSFINANSLPTGVGHEYIVFFPPGIDSCIEGLTSPACSGTNYCGYHGTLNAGTSEEVEYANEPDNGDLEFKGSCTGVTGKSDAYQTINTTSHEVSESVTDPEVEEHLSWYDQNKLEIEEEEFEYGEVGDMCAWEFKQGDGALETDAHTPSFDQTINGHEYLLQTEWDNAHSTCSVSEKTASTKAAFTDSASAPAQTGQSISFDASASRAPVAIKTYEWNWGDGSQPTTGTSATAAHTYASTGGLPVKSFPVTLKVTDENGNTSTTEQKVEIEDRKPVAEFSAPSSLTAGTAATFDGSSSSDPDGTIVSYSWDFGDGTPTVSGATPEHTYFQPGQYTVTLTATDDAGQQASVSHIVTVAGASVTVSTTGTEKSTTSETTHSSIVEMPIASLTSGPFSGNVKTVIEEPSNAFKVLSVKRNRRNGSVSLRIAVGAPGVITLRTAARRKGAKPTVRPMTRTIARSGSATLQVKPALATLTRLRRRHRVSLKVLITFTPTGGSPHSVVQTVTLIFGAGRSRK